MDKLKGLLNDYLQTGEEQYRQAFYQTLFDLYYDRVFLTSCKYCRPYAEDITMDVFLKVLSLDLFTYCLVPKTIGSFLSRIARNVSIDYRRKYLMKTSGLEERDQPVDVLYWVNPAGYLELKEDLEKALSALPPRQSRAYRMMREGYSYEEIALELGVDPKSRVVPNLICRARKAIRNYLKHFINL